MTERKLKLSSDDLQIVWGEVYIPNIPDSDGDFMTSDSIRDMAYNFMQKSATDGRISNIDIRHNNKVVKGSCVVETFIARAGDPDFIEGSWVAGVYVADKDVWGAIKKGELNGFSLEALVHKTPVEFEMEIPPVVSGNTFKAGEADHVHEHKFNVAYGEDGTFLGGRTDIVNGHYHIIRRGTVSEESAGHRHKFAVIDSLISKDDIASADLATAGRKQTEQVGGKRKKRLLVVPSY